VISYLRDECAKIGAELIVADFYGEKKNAPFQEQVALVSRANIMIGMHGAGLNMFHYMPFNSVVVELHRGTNRQKNSANFVNHIREGVYLSTNAQFEPSTQNLMKKPIWNILQEAISEWEKLESQTNPK
jgi:capsular polysaccharide biosynthesis protein